jgi:MFS transporter, PAT family, beta-lactamase induction signal transducer AmpG
MPQIYVLLFSLYWAQGLPVGFMTHALPVILRAEGLSLAQIGGFGILMLPWSIKVLWAPMIDRYASYRCWIMPLQVLMILSLILLSFLPIHALDQPRYLLLFFVLLLLMNFAAATQDIATDGLAVHLLERQSQHWGNTLQVIGSRLGFIVGGGMVLWALDLWHWQTTFLMLAALVALNSLAIFLATQLPHRTRKPTPEHTQSIKHYFAYFKSSPELWAWLGVLLSFKVADGLAGPILKPFMVDLGLSLQQIGLYITVLGAVAALIGAGVAGVLLKFLSRVHALTIFSILKIVSLLAYLWLAIQYEQQQYVSPWLIYSINAAEDCLSSMLLVVMLTLIMQYSRKAWAGTDFTLQVAIMATISGGLYMLSGIAADLLGYARYLTLIVAVALLSLYPIYRWKKQIGA